MPKAKNKFTIQSYKKEDLKKGMKFSDRNGIMRIMAIEEGYVMARRSGCAPFCQSIEIFLERINYIPSA